MARRRAGELRLYRRTGVWRTAVVSMSGGCPEASRPGRRRPKDEQPGQRV